jgi:hypothetical protein
MWCIMRKSVVFSFLYLTSQWDSSSLGKGREGEGETKLLHILGLNQGEADFETPNPKPPDEEDNRKT